jgi:hypothetical protein
MKSFIKNLSLAVVTSSLFLAYAPMAEEKKAHVIHINKNKIVESLSGDDAHNISKIIMLDREALSNSAELDEKLAELEPDIRDKVLSILDGIDVDSFSDGKDVTVQKSIVKILRRDDETGEIVDIVSEDNDIDVSVLNLEEIIGSHVELGSSVVKIIDNPTQATIRMIKQGEFTQNELDQIQVALDEKR